MTDAASEATYATGGFTAEPVTWIGAPAPGGVMHGLALPAAAPTPSQLYAPRGVWLDDDRLIVADTGNHRVLIWHTPTPDSHSPADVVLGQPDFTTEGAQAGGRGPERGMRLPTGIAVVDGRLIVADAWNHRLLIWDRVPEASDVAPDAVVGQLDTASVDENQGGECGPATFYWPFGVAHVATTGSGRFYVADTGNRRVLAWDGVPEPGQEPKLVLGQSSGHSRDENRGELGPRSFRWPHDIAGTAGVTFVADAGNHRILGWTPRPDGDDDADMVLGQPDFESADEWPYGPQSATAFRFPYAVDVLGGTHSVMAIADTANNRILVWESVPTSSGAPADHVLGQPDFTANGENRWQSVEADTLCWPYGVRLHRSRTANRPPGTRLAVADSGNNRVMIWQLESGRP